ncbi:RNA polymerase sigma factor [Wenyingzhuangia sp. IMCC45574]
MKTKEPSICEEKNYNHLFRTYYEPATKFIFYKCGNLEQAEDIVQNVFVKLWKLCATISFSKAKSYIYTACRNMFLNDVAHQKVVLKHQKTVLDPVEHENPAFNLELEEFQEKLNNAINLLTDKDREVFLLSRIEDKSYKEISEITGLTIKAVERRMSKTMLKLREHIGKEYKF